MGKGDSEKGQELGLERPDASLVPEEVMMKFRAEREARIGATAERILLSYAERQPWNFLRVEFAQEIRNVALVLHGEEPKCKAGKKQGECPADSAVECP